MSDLRICSPELPSPARRLVIGLTVAQLRAARASLGLEHRQLAKHSGVSLPTIQRIEASEGNARGVVDTLTKVIEVLDRLGVDLIGEESAKLEGWRSVRLKAPSASDPNPDRPSG